MPKEPAALLWELNLEWEGLATGRLRDWPGWKAASWERADSSCARTLRRPAHPAAPSVLEAPQESLGLSKLKLVSFFATKEPELLSSGG